MRVVLAICGCLCIFLDVTMTSMCKLCKYGANDLLIEYLSNG